MLQKWKLILTNWVSGNRILFDNAMTGITVFLFFTSTIGSNSFVHQDAIILFAFVLYLRLHSHLFVFETMSF